MRHWRRAPGLLTFKLKESPEGRMFTRVAALTMGICVGAVVQYAPALAGDRSPTMGETHPADVVLARRILMAGIGREMDEITGMIEDAATFNLGEAREHADVISTMLLAFPHLFPVETDNWTEKLAEDDPAHVSLALRTVWQNYDDFVARAQQASQTALDASFATTAEQFKALAKGLQQACDSCHQAYRRP
jgi:cytochrome c556